MLSYISNCKNTMENDMLNENKIEQSLSDELLSDLCAAGSLSSIPDINWGHAIGLSLGTSEANKAIGDDVQNWMVEQAKKGKTITPDSLLKEVLRARYSYITS